MKDVLSSDIELYSFFVCFFVLKSAYAFSRVAVCCLFVPYIPRRLFFKIVHHYKWLKQVQFQSHIEVQLQLRPVSTVLHFYHV